MSLDEFQQEVSRNAKPEAATREELCWLLMTLHLVTGVEMLKLRRLAAAGKLATLNSKPIT